MNALDILKYGNRTLLVALESVDLSDWQTPDVCGYWSVKDIVAHLASYEAWHVDIMHSLLEDGSETPTLDLMLSSGDRFNDTEVPKRSSLTAEEVLQEYRQNHAELMGLAAQVPQELFTEDGVLPWYGAAYCLDDFLVFTSYGHKREHTAQVNLFRDSLI